MISLKKQVKISGVGVHSGNKTNLVIKKSNKKGIFFKRTDLKKSKLIKASFDNVFESKFRNTTIGNKDNCIKTIEHLMCALFICGIDSAIIETDNVEVPILDGSANEFLKALKNIQKTKGQMTKIFIKKEIIATQKEIIKTLPLMDRIKLFLYNFIHNKKSDGFIKISPNDKGLNINATLVYKEPIIGTQTYNYFYDGSKKNIENFEKNIAKARTFGKYSEWEYLKKRGMARGANEKNVIALNDKGDGVLNNLLWKDEFVRHKIIDILGDFFTSGGFVYANVESYKGSHALNNLLLRKVFSNKKNYEIKE